MEKGTPDVPGNAEAVGAKAIDPRFTAKLDTTYGGEAINTMRQNALAESDAAKLVLNQRIAMQCDRSFSVRLDDWDVTSQNKSGRCWLFAATNLIRPNIIKEMKIKNFEFSQNWLMFWDKYEKANYFLESIIATADLDVGDRTVATIFSQCVPDGGQWNMFVNIVRKYGIVPKTVMPETLSSSATASMNRVLVGRLRVAAKALRDILAGGGSREDAREEKQRVLSDVYTVLRLHLGNPPERFTWQYTDTDNVFHREKDLTPLTFAGKYISLPLDDYICLVNDPRSDHPYGTPLSVEFLGNVIEGGIVTYLNVEIDVMKSMSIKALERGEPVWFGSDCGKMLHRDMSYFDAELYDWEGLYDMPVELESKEDRLLYGRTAMNHAMLFTGVDLDDGKPVKWRVENSWGDKGDGKGFFVMNDSWFGENMFEVAVRLSDLPAELKEAYRKPPITLPAWDPMGALAD